MKKLLFSMLITSFLILPDSAHALKVNINCTNQNDAFSLNLKKSASSNCEVKKSEKVSGFDQDNNDNSGLVINTPEYVFTHYKALPEEEGEEKGWTLIHKDANFSLHDLHNKRYLYVDRYHYESDSQSVLVHKNKNFFCTITDIVEGNYKINAYDCFNDMIGPYKRSFDDGSYIEGTYYNWKENHKSSDYKGTKHFFCYHFSNGNMLWGSADGVYFLKKFCDLIAPEEKVKYCFKELLYSNYPTLYFVSHEDTTKSYLLIDNGSGERNYNCFVKGDRCYYLTDNGWPIPYMQIIGDVRIYANETDTIVSHNNGVIKYANGDEVKLENTNVMGGDTYKVFGTIHRNGGVLKISMMNDKPRIRLTMPNGDFFTGTFKECNYNGFDTSFFPYNALKYRELTPYNGTWNRGGNIETIERGRNTEEVMREKAAKVAKEKAEQKAAYDKVCKEYGKIYVDAALEGKVIIGMPEKLFRNSFKTRLVRTSGVSTLYQVYGFGIVDGFKGMTISNNVLQMSVWVSQGRVSDIRHW